MIVFFQAEDGIRDLVRSRGLGDVYKRQVFINEIWENEIVVTANKNKISNPSFFIENPHELIYCEIVY